VSSTRTVDENATLSRSEPARTSDRILDTAEELVQTRGLNAMSYADISERVGITKASLHYHFPSKADLVRALVERYSTRFFAVLAELEASGADPAELVRGYADIYAGVLARGRMCLCGMLASDYATLPTEAQDDVAAFFARNEQWLEGVIREGIASGRLTDTASPLDAARALLAGLEGAMLVSRPFEGTARFDAIAAALLAGLGVPADQSTTGTVAAG